MAGVRARKRARKARPHGDVRVLADSHAVVWHLQGSRRLPAPAVGRLPRLKLPMAWWLGRHLVHLWYVTQTTRKVTSATWPHCETCSSPRPRLPSSRWISPSWTPLRRSHETISLTGGTVSIVGTARALALLLVTRDGAIRKTRLGPTIGGEIGGSPLAGRGVASETAHRLFMFSQPIRGRDGPGSGARWAPARGLRQGPPMGGSRCLAERDRERAAQRLPIS